MADNDQNDEYKFAELDSMDHELMGDTESNLNEPSSHPMQSPPRKDIRRNALIAVGLIVFAMVMYKLIGMIFYSAKTETMATKPTTAPIVTPKQPIATTPVIQQPVVINDGSAELKQKVSAIEVTQQSVRSEVTTMSEQVGSVTNSVNSLNNQISSLNQLISNLSNQVAKQSEEINMLRARLQPKKPAPMMRHRVVQSVSYYIQAVIPGRAWLIGTNGSTLTVREGTRIAGYGVVKLIDSMQGKILTSSGRTIRFSQEDS